MPSLHTLDILPGMCQQRPQTPRFRHGTMVVQARANPNPQASRAADHTVIMLQPPAQQLACWINHAVPATATTTAAASRCA